MSKNAYEIRLDVLQMAHTDEYNKYSHKIDVLRCQGEEAYSQENIDILTPRTEDIIARAEELYKFVSEKE